MVLILLFQFFCNVLEKMDKKYFGKRLSLNITTVQAQPLYKISDIFQTYFKRLTFYEERFLYQLTFCQTSPDNNYVKITYNIMRKKG